ncbi:hypothetical protein [Actinospongicola halichondriae]|uniref:hypothetical protein n=1 Tax=Actinospongicola halichondriae TaxID=3236844 RepID=UPI003D55DD8C
MAFRPWARTMQSEAEKMPETLATIREAAENFRQASLDLSEVVETLKRVTTALDAAGLAEATEIIRTSGEVMRLTAGDMRSAQESFSAMNEAFVNGLRKLPGGDVFKAFRLPR